METTRTCTPGRRRVMLASAPIALVATVSVAAVVDMTLDDFHLPGTQVLDVDPSVIAPSGHCIGCHGPLAIGGGSIPDLRYASAEVHERFAAIVVGGAHAERGMPAFGDALDAAAARAIQAYLLDLQARASREAAAADGPPAATD